MSVEDYGEHVSTAVMVIMNSLPPKLAGELCKGLSPEGWYLDISARCRVCGSAPMRHPGKPNVLVCLRGDCCHVGQTPDECVALFVPRTIAITN